jgi:hypothetical protein
MNERIKLLAKQAGIKITPMVLDGDEYEYEDVYMDGSEDLEKFAELIVRECIETLRLVPYDSDREFGDEVIYQDAVKQHFGVEE